MSKLEVLQPVGDWFRDKDDIVYTGHGLSAIPVSAYLYYVKMSKSLRREHFGDANRCEFMELIFHPDDDGKAGSHEGGKRASRIISAYDGLTGFIDAVETGRLVRPPTFLVAHTNRHMVQLSERIGFETISEKEDFPTEIVIAARYDDVHEVIAGFEADRMQKIREWVTASAVVAEEAEAVTA
jgi:hypothetical protein